jgi:tetratricopeptide (TPR) repeat protein
MPQCYEGVDSNSRLFRAHVPGLTPRAAKAIPYLAKAEVLSPDNPKIHEELGQVFTAQQDLPKAQAELEKAIALAPDTSALHFKLGQIYRKEGRHDLAQHEFDICSKLSSTHSSTNTPNPPDLDGSKPR